VKLEDLRLVEGSIRHEQTANERILTRLAFVDLVILTTILSAYHEP
jgi:hypothetical protein